MIQKVAGRTELADVLSPAAGIYVSPNHPSYFNYADELPSLHSCALLVTHQVNHNCSGAAIFEKLL